MMFSGSITTSDALVADNIVTQTPTVGSPALGSIYNLTPSTVATGNPVLGTPTANESNFLTASSISTGVPVVSSPSVSQGHILSTSNILTGIPQIPSIYLNGSGRRVVLTTESSDNSVTLPYSTNIANILNINNKAA